MPGGARLTLAEADTSVASTTQRNRAGLASIADVLQAQTVQAQSQLDLEAAQGAQQAARASLAVSMGIPPNANFDTRPAPDSVAVAMVTTSVDTLINRALALRPDLAALRVEIDQARAGVSVARSAMLPSFTLGSTVNKGFSTANNFTGVGYTLQLGITVPIFNLARPYNVRAAEEQVAVAGARADLLRTQVAQEVYTSYYALETSTQRTRTSAGTAHNRHAVGGGGARALSRRRGRHPGSRHRAGRTVQCTYDGRRGAVELGHCPGATPTRHRRARPDG